MNLNFFIYLFYFSSPILLIQKWINWWSGVRSHISIINKKRCDLLAKPEINPRDMWTADRRKRMSWCVIDGRQVILLKSKEYIEVKNKMNASAKFMLLTVCQWFNGLQCNRNGHDWPIPHKHHWSKYIYIYIHLAERERESSPKATISIVSSLQMCHQFNGLSNCYSPLSLHSLKCQRRLVIGWGDPINMSVFWSMGGSASFRY